MDGNEIKNAQEESERQKDKKGEKDEKENKEDGLAFLNTRLNGMHGYPLPNKDMNAVFLAMGPSIMANSGSFSNPTKRVPAPKNTDVYRFLARLLGVPPEENDGSSVLDTILVRSEIPFVFRFWE